jgi:dipeptidyl aminopeptidase/acylaminoacyl peptidase
MRYLRFPKRRPLLFAALALTVGLAGWLVHSRTTRSQGIPPAKKALPPITLEDPYQGYSLQDGVVVGSPALSLSEKGVPAPPSSGKVDTLDMAAAYARANQLSAQTKGRVFKATLTPHWLPDNTHFWYRNDLKGGGKEFILVNAEKGTRGPAFDHRKLAEALSQAANGSFQAKRLPFDAIAFTDGLKAVRFEADGKSWECDLEKYECKKTEPGAGPDPVEKPAEPEATADDEDPSAGEFSEEPQQKKKGKGKKQGKGFAPAAVRQATSPDGNWTAFVKENNVYLRDKDGKETQVTQEGKEGDAFSGVAWSPDSKTVVAYRTEPGDNKQVYLLESSPRDQLPAKLHQRPYPRPGDRFARHEMWVISVADPKPVKADVERVDYGSYPRLRWAKDGRHFTFEKADRGHQRFRVIEVDAQTGKTRDLIGERAETFIWSVHNPREGIPGIAVRYLDKSGEILLVSQRDGWKHLYLVDAKEGKIKSQITRGEWVVRAIEKIDEDKRQIWFRASGKNPDQDPYLIHHYRVNFDGTGLVALTTGNGTHTIKYSPDEKYLIDTYSRVDLPPVHELRRVADGSLVCELEKADVSSLRATGWRAPEVFVAKGRDGKTDIWGIVCRPQNFDPAKKYPVIEYIYAGPHDSHVPKTFTAFRPTQALAELGFIVVQIDGMGTANRSRAFHDVCWKNLADAGFPDRILWIKALAKKYAYVDAARVGIYGTSAGGQNALGALLFHPEFYKVAVAACGCHDNRLDKASWNEQWMGLMGPHYEKQSNVTNAHELEGRLMLILGEMDTNVPPESTMRVVDALIRAGKEFELIVVPGMGHSNGGAYGTMRQRDFFVRHLHGTEPPNRNKQ